MVINYGEERFLLCIIKSCISSAYVFTVKFYKFNALMDDFLFLRFTIFTLDDFTLI